MLCMMSSNARILLELEREFCDVFPFKSGLSRTILLVLASAGGECALKHIFRSTSATSIAVRQHVHYLMESRLLRVLENENNHREKIVQLTEEGLRLLKRHESNVDSIISLWRS